MKKHIDRKKGMEYVMNIDMTNKKEKEKNMEIHEIMEDAKHWGSTESRDWEVGDRWGW